MGRGGGRPPPAAMAEPAEEDELPVPGECCHSLTGDGAAGRVGRPRPPVAFLARFPTAAAAVGAVTGAPRAASLPRRAAAAPLPG